MNFKLDYEGYEQNLFNKVESDELRHAEYLFKFDNDYGAFINLGAYYSWKLEIVRFDSKLDALKSLGVIQYPHSIGYVTNEELTDEEVRNLLAKIKEL